MLGYMTALVVAVSLWGFCSLRRPDSEWFDASRSAPQWGKINIVALASSVLVSLFAVWSYDTLSADYENKMLFLTAVGISSASLTYVAAQSWFTDLLDFRVDRKLLHVGIVQNILAGVLMFLAFPGATSPHLYAIYVILAILLLMYSFRENSRVGQSDARAVLLVVVGCFPILGNQLFTFAGLFFAVLVLGYAVFLKFGKKKENAFTGKHSYPIVPMIVSPYAFFLSFAPVIAKMIS